MTDLDTIYNCDCLEGLSRIPSGSVDQKTKSTSGDEQTG